MKLNLISTQLAVVVIAFLFLLSFAFAAPTSNAGSPQTVNIGANVSLDGSGSSCSSCSIVSYNWNFADNTSATGVNTNHTYSSSGVYTVSLVVVANDGSVSSSTVAITVQSSDTNPPTLNHTTVTNGTNNTAIAISAVITDNVLVSSATLYYKNNNSGSFSSTSMSASGNTYSANIPSSVVNTSGVQYYISTVDSSSNSNTSPASAPTVYYNVSIGATDTIPPSTFLVSVEGDTASSYWDTSNNSATSIAISGESGMSCRYGTSDSNYSSMSSGQSCTVTSSSGNCTIASLNQANYNYSVACQDSSSNIQNATNNVDVSFGIDFTAPTNVSSISAIPRANATILLNWTLPNDSVSGVANQKIYRNGTLITTTSSTATTYSDTNVTNGQVWSYQVRATDNAGNAQSTGTNASATGDSVLPNITAVGPNETFTVSTVTLNATTSENSTCRYSTSNLTYSNMSSNFSTTGTTIHNISLTSLSNAAYTYFISCADTAGNVMTTNNFTSFAVSVASSSSSSSSTTTTTNTTTTTPPVVTPVTPPVTPPSTTPPETTPSGVQPPASQLPDIAKERVEVVTTGGVEITIPRVAAEQRASASISQQVVATTGVSDVSFTATKALTNVKIDIKKIDTKPAEVPEPPNQAFKYLSISVENIATSDISKAAITFKLEKSALNGKAATSIVLSRFADGKWNNLPTSVKGSDDLSFNFEAETPGFSYFAVTFSEEEIPVAPAAETVANIIAPTAQQKLFGLDTTMLIGLVIVLIVLAYIYMTFIVKKSKK